MLLTIRKAMPEDRDQIWQIIRQVIATGDTYVFDPKTAKRKMLAYWFSKEKHIYVAECEGVVVGTFLLKNNQPDLGSHIANASYMTLPSSAGRGVGRAMGAFSIVEAKRLGYKAMQFNIVIKTNERAVRLWQSLGFEIIGEIPEAFDHAQSGLVNAYIMYQKLLK